MLELVCLQDCVGEAEGAGWEEGACTCELGPASERPSGHAPATNGGGWGEGGASFITGGGSRRRREREASGPIAAVSLCIRAYLYNVFFLSLLTN